MIKNRTSDLPAEEYNKFVSSLFSDRKTMVIGTIGAVVASVITYLRESDVNILFFSLLFVLICAVRFYTMSYYIEQTGEDNETDYSKKWEIVAVLSGISMALCLGIWVSYIIHYSEHSFSILVAVSTCLAHMVGVAGRNFGADILVTSQSLAVGLPMVSVLMLKGDGWNIALGLLFIPFFSSARFIATSIRSIFLEVIRSNVQINYLAKHDILTGLSNRTSFNAIIGPNLKVGDSECILAIFDIDDFKNINDKHGQLAGDHLLVELSKRLIESLGSACILSRFGGDEFVIFYPGTQDQLDADSISQKVFNCFEKPFHCIDNLVRSSCSIGIAVVGPGKLDLEDLLMKADLALHEAKEGGKGIYRIYTSEMNAKFLRKQDLRRDLPNAVKNGELMLVYQPTLNVHENRVSCCESLVRWTHHKYGPVAPDEFIPLAETIGCISGITRYVVREAIRQCSTWPEHIGVSINLSAVDLVNPLLIQEIEGEIRAAQIDPHRLIFEVTETAILDSPLEAAAVLGAFRKLGIRIALDDFGTGYANFSYLVDIPFDKMKIDRSITVRIIDEDRTRILLGGLGAIAKNLNMQVTVEGVETQAQIDAILESPDIDELQGYYLSMPLPKREIRTLLEKQTPDSTLSDRRVSAS